MLVMMSASSGWAVPNMVTSSLSENGVASNDDGPAPGEESEMPSMSRALPVPSAWAMTAITSSRPDGTPVVSILEIAEFISSVVPAGTASSGRYGSMSSSS